MFRPGSKEKRARTDVFAQALLVCALLSLGTIAAIQSPIAALFTILLFLLVVNYWLSRDVLYPAFVFCSIWLIATGVHIVSPIVIDPPSWSAVAIFVGGAGAFTIGCAVGNRPLIRNQASWVAQTINPQPRRLLLLYSILTLPLFFLDTVRLAGGFSLSSQFMISARDALIDAPANQPPYSNKIISSAPIVSILCAWLFLMEEESRIFKSIAVILALSMCVLGTGRNMLLQFLVGWLVIAFFRSPNRSLGFVKGKAIALVLVVVALLMSVSLITKRETQDADALRAARDIAITDIAESIPAFSYGMTHPDVLRQGDSAHGTFVSVPLPTNVYTFYQNVYLRSGALGCLSMSFLVGLAHGVLFSAARRGNRVALFCLAYLFYALALSIFTDAYGLILRHVEVIAYAICYFGFLRQLPRMTLVPKPRFQIALN